MQLATDQNRNRTELVGERVRQGKGLADRQIEKASVEGQSRWPKPTQSRSVSRHVDARRKLGSK